MAFTSIDNPELYFQWKLYTGNGTDDTSITLDGTENMQPDLVWLKRRDNAGRHRLFDSVRGATKSLRSDDDENEITAADSLKSFDSDGFTLGADSASGGINVNINTETMVAWCWKESATAGFDIVSYTGNGSARTISHSLSAKPHWIIVKNRSDDDNYWQVQHKSLGATKNMLLNDTNAVATVSTFWNDTEGTTSVFSVGTHDDTNENTDSIIAYLWSEKQGFSKFGSYLANNSADGNFIYLGFRPAFFMVKSASGGSASARNWRIYDNKRANTNGTSTVGIDEQIFPNTTSAEVVNDNELDFCSNGVKIRCNDGGVNTSGETYIWMAFAEAPFVNSKKIPCNANGAE